MKKRIKIVRKFKDCNKFYFPNEIYSAPEEVARRYVSRGDAQWVDEEEIIEVEHEKVSIVILVKDALDYVKRCIGSLIKYTQDYELIIVDNGSEKETKEYLKSLNIGYTLIENSKNMGVSYGWNQGIKVAKYDYICFLNSDTVLTPNWLGKLMRGFKYSKNVGIVGPTSNGGPTVWGAQVVRDIKVEDIEEFAKNLNEDFVEAVVVGFCWVVKKEVFSKIGVFDWKRYGIACYEDMDFLWRASKAGFKSIWCKRAYVHHFGNKTMQDMGIDASEIRKKIEPILIERKRDKNLYIENDAEIKSLKIIKPKIKAGFVTYQNAFKGEVASTRIRVTWPLKYMDAIVTEDESKLNECNIVIFQTRYSKSDVELARRLKAKGKKIISDFTDPHWLKEYQAMDNNFVEMVGLSDLVTLPTDSLAETFKQYFNKPVRILKDRIDLDLYNEVKEHKDKKSLRILWYGSRGNLASIELARDDLEKLGSEIDVTLVCLYDYCDKFKIKPFENVKLEVLEWTNQKVIDELLKSDIAINPRFNNWKSYKSNNKTITAWALGIPCVERDFYNQIKQFLDYKKRNEEGKRVRQIVEKEYDVRETAREWEEIFSSVLNKSIVTETTEASKTRKIKSTKNIVVYTAICGDRDTLREDQFYSENADYIAFLDKHVNSKIWQVKDIYHQFVDPAREAKIFKVLPYQYLGYEYFIWIDGSIAIKCDPKELIDKYLNGYDMALFKHAARDDIYDEYIADFLHRTKEPKYLRELQRDKYLKEGFPKHSGLFECGVILRRNTEAVKRCMETWWAEICAFTHSDQCSFIYSVKKHNFRVNILPGNIWNNQFFNLRPHYK